MHRRGVARQHGASPVGQLIRKAHSLHVAGKLEKAQRIYKSVLKKQPDNADALHLLGVSHRQNGKPKLAVEYIEKAIRSAPNQAVFYSNLCRAQQDIPEVPSETVLANAEKALTLDPNQREAAVVKAMMLWRLQRHDELDRVFKKLVAQHPSYKDGISNYANYLRTMHRYADALPLFDKLRVLEPASVTGHLGRIWCRLELDDLQHVELELFAAIEQFPDNDELCWKAAEYLYRVRRFTDGLDFAKDAVAGNPACPHRRVLLGLCEMATGKPQQAVESFKLANELHPNKDHAIDWNLSLAYFASGDFENGWKLHDARFRASRLVGSISNRQFEVPTWQGEDISQKTIMVWTDQGIGDIITSGIMLHDLQRVAGRIIYEGPVKTHGMFQRAFPSIQCRSAKSFSEGSRPDYDFAICITDLGRHFRKTPTDFLKATRPGFTFDRGQARGFLSRLGERANGPIIGVSWRSKNLSSARRSVYLSAPDFSPVLDFDGVTYINLQYVCLEKELAFVADKAGEKFVDFNDVDLFDDLESALSLSAICDVVVSANTTAAVLPGVLNIPVFSWGGYYPVPLLDGKFIPSLPSIYHYQMNDKLPTTQVIPHLKEQVARCLDTFSPDARNERLGL